jgi:archaemetzincin
MRIGILRIGRISADVADRIQETLSNTLPETTVSVIEKEIEVPQQAFNETRKQYRSDIMLTAIRNCAEERPEFDRVLGIVDVDIFISRLNFVFGEAEHPGKAAVISLWRLRPEFGHQPPNEEVFEERSAKEALHEIGHTLGLDHCTNPFCAMHFSNSILETDVKKTFFCSRCTIRVETALGNPGKSLEGNI